jgi:hypothetical protein
LIKKFGFEMDPSLKPCWISLLALLATALFFLEVGAFEIDVQKDVCVWELVENTDRVSGSFVIVNQGDNDYSMYDDVELQAVGPQGNGIVKMKAQGGSKFDFEAPRDGYYKFCFINLNPSKPKKVDFEIHVGHTPHEAAKDEHFSPLQVKIGELGEALAKVSMEQKFLKARDIRHRRTNESTSKRIMWYSALEYFSLVGVSVAQIFLIRSLFSKRVGYNSV